MTQENKLQADPTKFGSGTSFDQQIWNKIENVINNSGIETREVVENFILFHRRVNFAKLLAHIEIFNKNIGVPGSIVECGVFKGVSLLTFLKLVEIHSPGDTLKKIIGFDTFSGFPNLTEKDGSPDTVRGKVDGGWNSEDFFPFLEQIVNISQEDSMIPRFKRVELVKGDVCKTIPEYVKNNPGLRISLLHLDLDLYEPTKVALEYLYPLVVSGGIVLLDEYAMNGFPGESKAFDEYFGDKRPKLVKFPYISTPGGYFIKEG
ncbi:MAG: TylF/MycF/NovP-related O-methyltransferase [Candidatus Sericytochromatia bacterium]